MRKPTTKQPFLLLIMVMLIGATLLLAGCVDQSRADTAVEAKDSLEEEDVARNQIDKTTPAPVSETPAIPVNNGNSGDKMQESKPDTTAEIGDKPISQESDFSPDQIGYETRAIWSRVGQRPASSSEKISKQDIDELVAKVDAAHLNTIFLLVYYNGTAYFEPSQTRFPNSNERLSNQSIFVKGDGEQTDALKYLLAIRDKRRSDNDPLNDFEVHAWFTVIFGGNVTEDWPPVDKTKPYMLNAIFPEFKQKFGAYYLKNDEQFINHKISTIHQPRYRAYMIDLIAGLVEDYSIDGVHLDDIRAGGICFNNEPLDYPGTEYDYPGCQEDYKAWTRANYGQEYSLWDDTNGHKRVQDENSGRVAAWLEEAVDSLVKGIHEEVKAIRPGVIISVAASPHLLSEEARKASSQGQAIARWLDQGWIDAAFLMTYNANTQSVIDTVQEARDAVQKDGSRLKIFPGLLTFTLRNKEEQWSYLIQEQISATMRGSWSGEPLDPPAEGVVLFHAEQLSEEAIDILAEGPFREPTLPSWRKSEP